MRRTDVNREAPDVVIGEQLALAGVQAGANVDVELADRIADGDGTADGATRAVERGEHSVTERLDEPPPVAIDLGRRKPVALTRRRRLASSSVLRVRSAQPLQDPVAPSGSPTGDRETRPRLAGAPPGV